MSIRFILLRTARAAALACLLAAAASGSAGAAQQWQSGEFHAVVHGTSTLHDWSVESRAASGSLTLTDGAPAQGELRLAAKSLVGSSGGLNSRMYKALKADAYPEIRFELLGLDRPGPAAGESAETWTVRGRLTVAGQSREITLAPRVTPDGAGGLQLEVETSLKMTDFGIKPPTFMGMVKTGDTVNLNIRWLLKPGAAGPAAG